MLPEKSFRSCEEHMLKLLTKCRKTVPADYTRLCIAPLGRTRSSLAYFEFGDPNGRALLCLHGLGVSGLFFAQYHDYFVAIGVRAIAPCLLGGIYVPDSAKTIENMVSELVELLDVLDVETFDVMGFSWGTLPELALMVRVPKRIGRAGFWGAMTPLAFLENRCVDQLKDDVRLTLKMVKRAPFMHRGLMALFCRLPISALLNQFKDEHLSIEEQEALAPGNPFRDEFARCLTECLRTGSRFFTDGWRMFLDRPGYALRDLGSATADIDVRLYFAERDNVHLRRFAELIVAGCIGVEVDTLGSKISQVQSEVLGPRTGVFDRIYTYEQCRMLMVQGAGRLACMLYFKDALHDLLRSDPG